MKQKQEEQEEEEEETALFSWGTLTHYFYGSEDSK